MSQINDYIYSLPQDIALTANTNNLNGIKSSYIHIVGTGPYELTGIVAPESRDHNAGIFTIENEMSDNLTLKENDVNSDAGNRFLDMGGDLVMTPGTYAWFFKSSAGWVFIKSY